MMMGSGTPKIKSSIERILPPLAIRLNWAVIFPFAGIDSRPLFSHTLGVDVIAPAASEGCSEAG